MNQPLWSESEHLTPRLLKLEWGHSRGLSSGGRSTIKKVLYVFLSKNTYSRAANVLKSNYQRTVLLKLNIKSILFSKVLYY